MIEIKREKKLWNNFQTWDKPKAYKSSKLGENDLMFEKTFFFYFPFLVSEPLSSYNQLGVIFFFLFLCVIYKEILGGVGGQVPPSPPSSFATGVNWYITNFNNCNLPISLKYWIKAHERRAIFMLLLPFPLIN